MYDDVALPWIRHVRRVLQQAPSPVDDPPLSPFTSAEVSRVLRRAPPRKTPGPDRVTYAMLRRIPLNVVRHLCLIYNSAFLLGYFLLAWKHGHILAISKPGKPPMFPQDRRPIQLLSSLGKVFERLILRRLFPFVLRNHLIPDEQFGFMPTHSTTHQVLRLVEHITQGYNSRLSTLAVFLDVHKAYDSTWHSGLFYKLRSCRVPAPLQAILRSFLQHRTFQVREDGCLSSVRPVLAGVPQGAVLSPLLYSIFTADVLRSPQSHLAVYADDIALFASGRHLRYLHGKIQRHLDAVLSWAARCRITVSAPKTQAILFSKRRILRDLPSLSLGDQVLQYSPSVLYLGVVLDRHLTWAPHLARCKRNFLGKLAHVTPLLLSPSLPLSTKLLLYTQYLRSSLAYASPAWLGVAPTRLAAL